MKRHIVMVTQPRASSGLGGYIAGALRQQGVEVPIADAFSLKLPKLWPTLRSFSFDRETWWRKRWENGVYSVAAWRRNTRLNGKLVDRLASADSPILQVGKEFFPHPSYQDRAYYVYILYNNRLALGDGVTPWIPPRDEWDAFCDLERDLFLHARHVFTGGDYVKRSLVSDYGLSPSQITVAGGGPHDDFIRNAPPSIPEEFLYTLVFVGWDFGMKGGADLLAAFRLARREIPALRLVVAGPGPDQVTPEEGVTVLGPVPDRVALRNLYRSADLFVMPSLRDSFGFVFLEAMSQGVPCIGASINAMPEIIADGDTGYVTPPRNPSALAEAICRYYADPSNRLRMGRNAMRCVHERFTWAHVASTIAGQVWKP